VALANGTTGTDINISGSPITGSGTITLNIPTASALNRGALSSADWTTFNGKFTGTNATLTDILSRSDTTKVITAQSLGLITRIDTTYNQVIIGANPGTFGITRQTSIGIGAGNGNVQADQTAIGYNAGNRAGGLECTAVGSNAGSGNGLRETAIGFNAGFSTGPQGVYSVLIGSYAGANSRAGYSVFIGRLAGNESGGNSFSPINHHIAIGENAGANNQYNHIITLGQNSTADEEGQMVFSKDGTIMARFSTSLMTASRKWNLPDANGTFALTNQFIDKEIPSGLINGSNVTFTLANTPILGSEHLYRNGILQEEGAGNDYTISGATITYLTAPLTGDKLRVTYRR